MVFNYLLYFSDYIRYFLYAENRDCSSWSMRCSRRAGASLQMSHRVNAERSRRAKTPTSAPRTIIKTLLREPKPPFCRHIDPSALPLDPFLEPKRHSWSCIPRLKPFNCHPDPARQEPHAPIQGKGATVSPRSASHDSIMRLEPFARIIPDER